MTLYISNRTITQKNMPLVNLGSKLKTSTLNAAASYPTPLLCSIQPLSLVYSIKIFYPIILSGKQEKMTTVKCSLKLHGKQVQPV